MLAESVNASLRSLLGRGVVKVMLLVLDGELLIRMDDRRVLGKEI